MPKYDYNVAVIGAGAAGLTASYLAAAMQAKVALVERSEMGGDCLNTGCVPSKALIRCAHMMADVKRAAQFGVRIRGDIDCDFAAVMQHVRSAVAAIAPHDSVARYSALGVDCIHGEAQFVDAHTLAVGQRRLTARNIIIAAGAAPFVPPIAGIDDVSYHTSDTIWSLTTLPKRLVVLGGGPIGCEFAQAFARLGSQVTVVEMAPRVLIREDDDIAEYAVNALQRDGVQLLTGHQAVSVTHNGNGIALTVKHNGNERTVVGDVLLAAVGRRARLHGYGLDVAGVQLTNGRIAVDGMLRTNVPHIYLCGDVTGPYQFTHAAGMQAWYACVNALFSPLVRMRVNYRALPWCTYLDPEIAQVGLNENAAREQGVAYETIHFDLGDVDRVICEGEPAGHIKVLLKPGSDTVLGATIVGAHAGELLATWALMLTNGIGLNKLLRTTLPYPTRSEGNRMTAGAWRKQRTGKRTLALLRWWHQWRR